MSKQENNLKDSYMDSIVDTNDFYAVFKQRDNTLAWRIEGLEDDNGSCLPPHKLKNDPPLLILESSNGDSVNFVLTKNLSKSLRDAMDRTYSAYYGIDKTFIYHDENETLKEKIKKIVSKNMIKLVITGLIVFILGITYILSII